LAPAAVSALGRLGHFTFMHKIKVTVLRADDNHREVDWPYEHIPRVGEHFCFEVGVAHVVSEVAYNAIDGGGFLAVVTVDRD